MIAPAEGSTGATTSGGMSRLRPTYFSAVAIELKVVVRLVPTSFTAVMITTEMRAAIRPYSMAVAPLSSFTKAKIFDMNKLLD